MECELKCDVCGIKFTKPFIRAIQQINCYECDFSMVWDGELTMRIIEKNLTYQKDDTQYFVYVDLIEEYLQVEIQQSKKSPELDGTVVAKMPVHYESVKLDYELIKTVLAKLERYTALK